MKKVVVKELKSEHLVFKIVFYAFCALLGMVMLSLPRYNLGNPTTYIYGLFYILAFFSLIAYFVNRKKDNYELLIFGFINIVVGTYLLINAYNNDNGLVLYTAMMMYTVLSLVNGIYNSFKLLTMKDLVFYIKISNTIILFYLGLIASFSLKDMYNYGVVIFGYYLGYLGLLSLLEVFLSILFKDKKIEKELNSVLFLEKKNNKSKKEENEDAKNKKPIVKDRTIKRLKK